MLLVAHRTPTSASACERLALAGAAIFEVDVQLDDRGRLVVSHYVPFGLGLLQRDNWRIRLRSAAARDPHVVQFAEAVPSGATVLLDLKERTPERRARLVATIADVLADRARYCACAPDPDDLRALRAAGFRTWRTVGDARELTAFLAAGESPDAAVTVRHTLLTPEVLRQLHDRAPAVVAWTVNNASRAKALHALGVDGITTDRVAVVHALTSETN